MPAGVIGGVQYTLNDIEGVLRAQLPPPGAAFTEDCRIHASIVCASISCPNVRTTAYMPDTIDAQLSAQMADMLSNPLKGFDLNITRKIVTLSKIFDWYSSDFATCVGTVEDSVLSFILPFLP